MVFIKFIITWDNFISTEIVGRVNINYVTFPFMNAIKT